MQRGGSPYRWSRSIGRKNRQEKGEDGSGDKLGRIGEEKDEMDLGIRKRSRARVQ